MAPDTDPSIHRQLGEMAASLRSISETQTEVKETLRRADDKASASRAEMYRKIDDTNSRLAAVEANIADVRGDVSEMRPVTDDVRRWKLMGLGALGMIGIGGMAIGVTFGEALRRIGALLIGR
ncbi:hypothetical protein BJF92_12265 [Rhizobium rhizosphaerae]|uniref:DUF1515 domain-containing protein n=1 Tax=Xaviernesmea rhizosphaerae TaxID=1672749 RepID=A0A1Q9ANC6_9HYPH|nr:DUF1515 family protein [Xaviernesmea rhizosphaerae]OLP56839.1 hypothetical protein BJF92_12265 [Xaviernesmea rhizosphaerae]